MRLFRRMKNAITKPKQTEKLVKWQNRYYEAKQKYSAEISDMKTYENLYNGSREVNRNPNKGGGVAGKKAINVRNITYELIETQVDSSIPYPKVIPIHEEDEEQAKVIEMALQNVIREIKLEKINDVSERVVPVQGGDFMHVEWDNTKGYHCTLGGISISERHPKNVIPQPGVTEIEDMDYIFVEVAQTKEFVKRKYGVDVSDAQSTDMEGKETVNSDIVTVIICYYRNANGNIGMFTWCEDYVLVDYEDYQARRLERCVECGRVKVGDVCECGSKKFKEVEEEYEEITESITLLDGTIVNPIAGTREIEDENGNIMVIEEKTKIPYYKPKDIPIILRRNVSKYGKLLGVSDVAVIEDQQDAVKKIGSKMQEKILKGGSIVTLPNGAKITTDDREMKIVRVKNPSEANLIDVKNIQGDVSQDRIMLETNYDWARSSLGITDSYQGKYDSSAQSGTAKQFSINQAAGRLESKRVMKNIAYADLYEMIFKHLLAYADQPIPLSNKNNKGTYNFTHFNRYDFLKRDAAGEYYWNDEFLFETDPTSTIMMNREALWQQIDLKYQAGAFGPIGEDRTLLTFWTFMEKNDYPNSAEMKNIFAERVREQEKQAQLAQMAQMQNGVINNEMPQM